MRETRSNFQILEPLAGVATGFFGLISSALAIDGEGLKHRYVIVPLFWSLPALAVSAGAFAHALRRWGWGYVLLWVGGGVVVTFFCFYVIEGILVYPYWDWSDWLHLIPGLMALLTMLCSYLSKAQEYA